jgi:hypothetical protein
MEELRYGREGLFSSYLLAWWWERKQSALAVMQVKKRGPKPTKDARSFCQEFLNYYNNHHHHSGIAMLTSHDVHYGIAQDTLAQRQFVLDTAFLAHPERFVRKPPQVQPLPIDSHFFKETLDKLHR